MKDVPGKLSKHKILKKFDEWIQAWNNYDLDGVMEFIHEDILFENWDNKTIIGKENLRKIWTLWFANHGTFRFVPEDLFTDEDEQKILFRWKLEWPSREPNKKGKREIRKGLDILHLQQGKIIIKLTYTKTMLLIDGKEVTLHIC